MVHSMKSKCVAIVAGIASMCCFTTPAFADDDINLFHNASDSGWSMSFATNSTKAQTTPPRQKQDTSYSYIKVQTTNKGRMINAKVVYAFGTDKAESATSRSLGKGDSEYIGSRAYENNKGPRQVRMSIKPITKYPSATETSGLWSPDSSRYK